MDHNHAGHDHNNMDNMNMDATTAPMGHDHMSMHPMAFHFGSAEVILFKFWDISSSLGKI